MPIAAIRSEDGNLCKSAEEQSERWQCHFTKVLNIESLFDPAVFCTLRTRPLCSELAELPTEDELARAIARLKNNKAPGESGILPEMVRHGGPAFFAALLALVHQV